jgi:hypothetical protein
MFSSNAPRRPLLLTERCKNLTQLTLAAAENKTKLTLQ